MAQLTASFMLPAAPSDPTTIPYMLSPGYRQGQQASWKCTETVGSIQTHCFPECHIHCVEAEWGSGYLSRAITWIK